MPDELIAVRPTELVSGVRRLWLTSRFGTSLWSIEDATALLIALTAGLERAIDPAPLPEELPVPRTDEPNFPIIHKPTLESLL